MAATRAISGVLGYSVAKAGIDSFTRWLAVEMARKHGDGVRVNAIAPGFFIAEQNRARADQAGRQLHERAQTIIAHTPMGRFGRPDELIAAVQWLCSDAASFVTGVVLPDRRRFQRVQRRLTSTHVAPASDRRSSYRWTIVALLFFATTINYIDRQVLGILAPTLQRELGW